MMKPESKRKKNRSLYLKIALIALGDLLAAALCVGIVVLFHYVLPKQYEDNGIVIAQSPEKIADMFALPGEEGFEENPKAGSGSHIEDDLTELQENLSGAGSGKKDKFNTTNTGTSMVEAELNTEWNTMKTTVTEIAKKRTAHYDLTVTKREIGEGDDKVTYFVADLYVRNVQYLRTAFARGVYGKNIRQFPDTISRDNNALFSISGDFYGNSERGVVIRNGVLYRENVADADICVLYLDGTMETYSPSAFDGEAVLKKGAWQAWTFGPQLLDGSGAVLDQFRTTSYLNKENPRCAIGYVAPGHYMLVTVDGRDDGYSRGVTITELAQIMAKLGCQTAYNLDGGNSACMYYENDYLNRLSGDERAISDIIYLEAEE